MHLIRRDRLLTAHTSAPERTLRGLAVCALLGEEVDAGFERHHGISPTTSCPQKAGTNRPLDNLARPRENRCRLVQIQEATWADFPLNQAVARLPLDRDAKRRPWMVPPKLDRGDGTRPDHAVRIARRLRGRVRGSGTNPVNADPLYRRLGFEHVDTNGVYFLMRWTPPQVNTAS